MGSHAPSKKVLLATSRQARQLFDAAEMFGQDNLEETVKSLSRVLIARPQDANLLSALAGTYKKMGDYGNAELVYRKALSIAPENLVLRNDLASLYLQQERLDDATAELTVILEKEPQERKARHSLGHVYEKLGRYEEAISEYLTAAGQCRQFSKGPKEAPENWAEKISHDEDRQMNRIIRASSYLGLSKCYSATGRGVRAGAYQKRAAFLWLVHRADEAFSALKQLVLPSYR